MLRATCWVVLSCWNMSAAKSKVQQRAPKHHRHSSSCSLYRQNVLAKIQYTPNQDVRWRTRRTIHNANFRHGIARFGYENCGVAGRIFICLKIQCHAMRLSMSVFHWIVADANVCDLESKVIAAMNAFAEIFLWCKRRRMVSAERDCCAYRPYFSPYGSWRRTEIHQWYGRNMSIFTCGGATMLMQSFPSAGPLILHSSITHPHHCGFTAFDTNTNFSEG